MSSTRSPEEPPALRCRTHRIHMGTVYFLGTPPKWATREKVHHKPASHKKEGTQNIISEQFPGQETFHRLRKERAKP